MIKSLAPLFDNELTLSIFYHNVKNMQDEFNYTRKNVDDYIYEVGRAAPADLDGILAILRPNWHRIYQGTLTPETLDRFIEDTIRPHYAGIINGARTDRAIYIAQTRSGTLCGFTCYGRERDAYQIQAIYVAPSHHKRSIGAMMMMTISDEMIAASRKHKNITPVFIRICTDNDGARQFANKLEGEILKAEPRRFLGADITDQIIGWRSAHNLNNCLRRKFSNSMSDVPEQIHGGREIFIHHALHLC